VAGRKAIGVMLVLRQSMTIYLVTQKHNLVKGVFVFNGPEKCKGVLMHERTVQITNSKDGFLAAC
jgi:hypothetical protein